MSETLGQRLRAWRTGRGITQNDVAKWLGFSSGVIISRIERGIIKIEPALAAQIEALIFKNTPPPAGPVQPSGQADTDAGRAITQGLIHGY